MWDDVSFYEREGKIYARASDWIGRNKSQYNGDRDFLTREQIESVIRFHQTKINDILKYKDAWLKQEGKI